MFWLDHLPAGVFPRVLAFLENDVASLVSLHEAAAAPPGAQDGLLLRDDIEALRCECMGDDCDNLLFFHDRGGGGRRRRRRGGALVVGKPFGCHDCQLAVCSRCSFLHRCDECHETKCYECELMACDECGKLRCSDCTFTYECGECGDTFCDKCRSSLSCNECDKIICFECPAYSCEKCYNFSCVECNTEIYECQVCQSSYCQGCEEFWSCGNILCNTRQCKKCGPINGGCSARCEWKMEIQQIGDY